MPHHTFSRFFPGLCLLLGFGLAAAQTAAGDEIYAAWDNELRRLSLDNPSVETLGPLTIGPTDMTFTPEGELLAVDHEGAIYSLDLETAEATTIREADPDDQSFYSDITALPGGQIYLIREENFVPTPLPPRFTLTVFDRHSGQETVIDTIHPSDDRSRMLFLANIAVAGDSLVGLSRNDQNISGLYNVGPGTAGATPIRTYDGGLRNSQLDVDSDGDLWIVTMPPIAPPTRHLSSIDPITGLQTAKASYTTPALYAFAIRREEQATCVENESALCLLNDRYRVTATWEDFEGQTGEARVVRGATDTTGLLWFFSGDNWELMVKVIDGCPVTNRVWAFVSGTTNAGYVVTVTDTVTGAERIFSNPLGQTSKSILDTEAFDTCSTTIP